MPTDETTTDEFELPASYGLPLVRYPLAVRFVKVGLLVVATLCGRLRVTAPVLALATTWFAVPVILVTPPDWLTH
jgi:hypothetical protein